MQTTRTGTTSSHRWQTGECPVLAAVCSHFSPPPVSLLGQRGRLCACDHRWNITWSVCVCVCLCTGGGLRARFNILLYPVLPSTAASGAQGAPQVHGTEVLSARHSHQGSPRAAGMGSGCSAQPFGRGGGLLTPCHPASWTRVCPSPRAWSTQGASGEHQWGQNRNNSNFVSPHLMHPAAWTCPSWPRRPRRSCKR